LKRKPAIGKRNPPAGKFKKIYVNQTYKKLAVAPNKQFPKKGMVTGGKMMNVEKIGKSNTTHNTPNQPASLDLQDGVVLLKHWALNKKCTPGIGIHNQCKPVWAQVLDESVYAQVTIPSLLQTILSYIAINRCENEEYLHDYLAEINVGQMPNQGLIQLAIQSCEPMQKYQRWRFQGWQWMAKPNIDSWRKLHFRGCYDNIWWKRVEIQKAAKIWADHCVVASIELALSNGNGVTLPQMPLPSHIANVEDLVGMLENELEYVLPIVARPDVRLICSENCLIIDPQTEGIKIKFDKPFILSKNHAHQAILLSFHKDCSLIVIWTGGTWINSGTTVQEYLRDNAPITKTLLATQKRAMWFCPPFNQSHQKLWQSYEDNFQKLSSNNPSSSVKILFPPHSKSNAVDKGLVDNNGRLTPIGVETAYLFIEENLRQLDSSDIDKIPAIPAPPVNQIVVNVEESSSNSVNVEESSSHSITQSEYTASPQVNYEVHMGCTYQVPTPIIISTQSNKRVGIKIIKNDMEPHKEFEAELHKFALSNMEDEVRKAQKANWFQLITNTLQKWRKCHLNVVGSTQSGLATNMSDLDITVQPCNIPSGYSNEFVIEELEQIKSTLWRCMRPHLNKNYVIKSPRAPIVRLEMNDSMLIDISFNSFTSLENTKFLRSQTEKYPLLKEMVILIKLWLQHNGINKAEKGYPNNFCYVLLLTYYLSKIGDYSLLPLFIGYIDYIGSLDTSNFKFAQSGRIRKLEEEKQPLMIMDPIHEETNCSANVKDMEVLGHITRSCQEVRQKFLIEKRQPTLRDFFGTQEQSQVRTNLMSPFTGLNKFLFVLLMIILSPLTASSPSAMFCNPAISGEYYRLTTHSACQELISGKDEIVWLHVYKPNLPSIEIQSSYCTKIHQIINYWENAIGEDRNQTSSTTLPVSKEECFRMWKQQKCQEGSLLRQGNSRMKNTNNQFNPEIEFSYFKTKNGQRMNCFQSETTIYYRPKTKSLYSPIGDLSTCRLEDEFCVLENGGILIWKKPSEDTSCPYQKLGYWKGKFNDGIWVKDGGEIALSFTNISMNDQCSTTLAISDQNYGIKEEQYKTLKTILETIPTKKHRRAIVESEQLAGQLTALSWNTIAKMKVAVCSLMSKGHEMKLLPALDATILARNLFNQNYIQAKWVSFNSELVIQIWRCIPIARSQYSFIAQSEPICTHHLPVNLTFQSVSQTAYLDTRNLIFTHSSINGSCSIYQKQSFMLEGQLIEIDQITGVEKIISKESIKDFEINSDSFGLENIETQIFHNLALSNQSDPAMQALRMYQAFRLAENPKGEILTNPSNKNSEWQNSIMPSFDLLSHLNKENFMLICCIYVAIVFSYNYIFTPLVVRAMRKMGILPQFGQNEPNQALTIRVRREIEREPSVQDNEVNEALKEALALIRAKKGSSD
jgi:hypothetical protein